MMLDYPKLLDKASVAFALIYRRNSKSNPIITFTKQASNCLDIFVDCASHLQQDAREQMASAT